MSKILEVIVAPAFSRSLENSWPEKNVRLLEIELSPGKRKTGPDLRKSAGCSYRMTSGNIFPDGVALPAERPWKRKLTTFFGPAVKHVKSNAIVIAKRRQTLGIGQDR